MASSATIDRPAEDRPADEPVTLHRVMQAMIGEELRERYPAPQKLSHPLFVLLIQLKEEERKLQRASHQRSRR
jgi:hypothetical protein